MNAPRVGVVGGGWIAESIVPAIEAAGATLIGLADLDPARRQRWSRVCPTHTAAAALLAARPDIVVVLTPTSTHADVACAALQAGAHVIVEKPLATDGASCARIVETARLTGRRALVEESYRWTPSHLAALELIAGGRIGAVRTIVHAFHGWRPRTEHADAVAAANERGWRAETPYGWVRDHAVHLFALSKLLAGSSTVTGVRAIGGPTEALLAGANWRCDAVDVVWLRVTSGSEGVLGPATGLHTRVVGSAGYLDVLGEGGRWGDGGPPAAVRCSDGSSVEVTSPPDLLWECDTGYYPVAHRRCIAASIRHLHGEEVPAYDAADATDDVLATESLVADARSAPGVAGHREHGR